MRNYNDVREHLDILEEKNLLVRVEKEINKDTEMHPLVRWQFRSTIPESKRNILGMGIPLGSGMRSWRRKQNWLSGVIIIKPGKSSRKTRSRCDKEDRKDFRAKETRPAVATAG